MPDSSRYKRWGGGQRLFIDSAFLFASGHRRELSQIPVELFCDCALTDVLCLGCFCLRAIVTFSSVLMCFLCDSVTST